MQKQRELLAHCVIQSSVAVERFFEQQLLDVARQAAPAALHRFSEHRRQFLSVVLHGRQTRGFEPPFRFKLAAKRKPRTASVRGFRLSARGGV